MPTNSPLAFTYPASAMRRHGPAGYSNYESFRPWLRDEFTFRCAYCLLRERWGRYTGQFDLDHFIPLASDPDGEVSYENVIYSCHSCNLKKGAAVLAPTALTNETVQVRLDGRLIGLTANAERLIDALALNSPEWMDWRLSWMRIVDLAAEHDEDLYKRLMGYPDDLPDLSSLRPPANTSPDGVEQSHFARHERGELPDTYLK